MKPLEEGRAERQLLTTSKDVVFGFGVFCIFFFHQKLFNITKTPLAFTHTKQASCCSALPGVCVSVIDVCTEPQLLEDTAPPRHLSPPQKQGSRYSDVTRNPKAAKAQLQGPWVGWGMRLSIHALAGHARPPYRLPLGTGLLDTSFCPKKIARPDPGTLVSF